VNLTLKRLRTRIKRAPLREQMQYSRQRLTSIFLVFENNYLLEFLILAPDEPTTDS